MKIKIKKNNMRKENKAIVVEESEVAEEVTANLEAAKEVVTGNLVAAKEVVEVVVIVLRLQLDTLKNLSLKVKMTIRCTLHQLVSK